MNPIQVFVETPYGLYEVIDWIAQAQLLSAVGSAKAKALRELSIRTIFDLEKCVFNPQLRARLLSLLVPNADVDRQNASGNQASPSAQGQFPDPDKRLAEGHSEGMLDLSQELDAVVAYVRDDLHVQRLRQIWDVVSNRLDDRPVAEDKPPKPETKVSLSLVDKVA
jgi:hypothetical protein